MRKKRIMFCSEWSELSSGYGVYYKKIISALNATGKYEILEMANYAKEGDPRLLNSEWDILPVMPHPDDQEGNNQYNSNPLGQFGLFKFEDACARFKPDIVISIFDYWYSSFILKSPYRNFFKMIWMPTVDSNPQKTPWLDTYALCDQICAYSYYGKKVLEEESCGAIKDIEVCSPGIDDDYRASDTKENIRDKFGIPQDINIVMMVCRNQMRKLICDFVECAEIFKKKYEKENPEFVKKTFFYVHTSNPDSGWEIEKVIGTSEASANILMTYQCSNCKKVQISNYKGIVFECEGCGEKRMQSVSVSNGIERQDLADIMSVADLGALVSIGEGFGMPIIEFKKVGVPVIMPPWSAMEEQCTPVEGCEERCLGGLPVKIQRMFTESATMQHRALFDREDFANVVFGYLNSDDKHKLVMSTFAKECTDNHFTWDETSKKWEEIVDKMDISDNLVWETHPATLFQKKLVKEDIPEEIHNDGMKLVNWCIDNYYNHSYFTPFRRSEIVSSLGCGTDMIDQFNKAPFNFDTLMNILNGMIDKHNNCENIRVGLHQSEFFEKQERKEFNTVIL